MRRRRRRQRRQMPIMDLTAMVDVVFNLLIFFMVSTSFITFQQSLPVDLPQAQTAQLQAGTLPTVTITANGDIYVGDTPVTEATLVAELRDEIAELGRDVVILRADQTVQHGLSVRAMDLIMTAGASRIAISTGNN